MSVEAILLGAAGLLLVVAVLWIAGRSRDGGGGDADGGGPTGGRGRGGPEDDRQQLE